MVPPITGSFELEIKTKEQGENLLEKLNEQEIKILFDALNKKIGNKEQKRESKETFTKSLEFEKDTFKIDSKGWKEVFENDSNHPIFGKFVKREYKVKVNVTGDVVEYLEGPAKGEQIFITYDAFIREVCKAKNCSKEEAEKKYLMTVDEIKEKMKDKPNDSEEYKKFFDKEIKNNLAGNALISLGLNTATYIQIGEIFRMWLTDGYVAYFDKSKWNRYYFENFGCSGRLLKN